MYWVWGVTEREESRVISGVVDHDGEQGQREEKSR